jgi:HD-GYP domain-containing protein (c-di-GMP phosphodiesterase class II)
MQDQFDTKALLHALLAQKPIEAASESDERILRLLGNVLLQVQEYSSYYVERINQLVQVGISLSAERDIDTLLEMILEQARRLTHADAGTLFMTSSDGSHLDFAIIQNDTLGIRLGGTSSMPEEFSPVPLQVNGHPNHANVCSHVALTGQMIAIPDVYETKDFDFSGPRSYDEATGYRTRSLLVFPMTDNEGKVIGVLQLLNAKNPATGRIVAFQEEHQDIAAALASQASVALLNARLVRGLRLLFESFIRSIATAVDCKSPYTGGHIRRVVDLTMLIADRINRAASGPFKDFHFSAEELEELRIAAWLHDVGKIATPEHVVDKHTRLETVIDRAGLVSTRFQWAQKCLEAKALSRRVELYQDGVNDPGIHAELQDALQRKLAQLREDMDFVLECNSRPFLDDEALSRLHALAADKFECGGDTVSLISDNELENLCIRRGTLTLPERLIIERHAMMTQVILHEIAFPPSLSQVPSFASSHHERLNGSGYPNGLTENDIPLQTRILAIADIFEALTASDRPYRKPATLSDALKILDSMNKDGQIDPLLHELFVSTGVAKEYSEQLK